MGRLGSQVALYLPDAVREEPVAGGVLDRDPACFADLSAGDQRAEALACI